MRHLVLIVCANLDVVRHLIVHTSVEPAAVAIDDDELVKMLAAMGRSTGIVRTEGRAWLTASVTDAERRRDEEDQSLWFDETGV